MTLNELIKELTHYSEMGWGDASVFSMWENESGMIGFSDLIDIELHYPRNEIPEQIFITAVESED